jgi:hypothetical protein
MDNPMLPPGLDRRLLSRRLSAPGKKAARKFVPQNPAQPIDKSRFGRENPRKSKEIQPSKVWVFEAKQPRPKKTQTDRTDQRRRPLPRRSLSDSSPEQSAPKEARSGRADANATTLLRPCHRNVAAYQLRRTSFVTLGLSVRRASTHSETLPTQRRSAGGSP